MFFCSNDQTIFYLMMLFGIVQKILEAKCIKNLKTNNRSFVFEN